MHLFFSFGLGDRILKDLRQDAKWWWPFIVFYQPLGQEEFGEFIMLSIFHMFFLAVGSFKICLNK